MAKTITIINNVKKLSDTDVLLMIIKVVEEGRKNRKYQNGFIRTEDDLFFIEASLDKTGDCFSIFATKKKEVVEIEKNHN